jgi:hypothetical protein
MVFKILFSTFRRKAQSLTIPELPYTIRNALCGRARRAPSPGSLNFALAQMPCNALRMSESHILDSSACGLFAFEWRRYYTRGDLVRTHMCDALRDTNLKRAAHAPFSVHTGFYRYLPSVLARAHTPGCGRSSLMFVPSCTPFSALRGDSQQMPRMKVMTLKRA